MRQFESTLGSDFDRFWLAAAVSNLGDGIRLAALPLLALALTDDARLIALVSAASLIPWVALGPFGGAVVDRRDRRRVMIGGQIGRGALALALGALAATGNASIWIVVVVALGLGAGEVFVDTASQAAIPQLVGAGQLDRANGRLIAAMTLFDQVIGVALGAVLFALAAGAPFAVDAATFLAGAYLLTTIRRPLQGTRTVASSVRADIAEGFRFIARHRLMRGLMGAVAVSNFAGNMSFGIIVVLVVDELGASEAAYGVLLGVGAVGGVLGSLVAGRLVERFGRRRLLSVLHVPMIASYLVNAGATAPWMVAISFGIASFAIVCFNVPGQSVRQTVTPEPLLGRVVASWRVVGMGAGPPGAVAGGFVAESQGVRAANVAAAAVEVIAWVLLLAALRHLDDALAAVRVPS